MYEVILFYNYTDIKNPTELMIASKDIASQLELKGRLIIAEEGLNGTFEGIKENIDKYVDWLLSDPRFSNTHIKRSAGTGHVFPKLSIKVRKEIVSGHLNEWDVNPNKVTGKYLTADELHDWFAQNKEFYIVDMRNDYEHKSGHFEGSVLPSLQNFRDLPKILPELESLKDKTVLTVCTGGVRCEKASGFLVNNGFNDVYQLYGGIVTYMEKYPNQNFKGKLYVFDDRILVGFNTDSPEHEIIGLCEKCGNKSENYVNCANNLCHKHFICCEECLNSIDGKPYCKKSCEPV